MGTNFRATALKALIFFTLTSLGMCSLMTSSSTGPIFIGIHIIGGSALFASLIIGLTVIFNHKCEKRS